MNNDDAAIFSLFRIFLDDDIDDDDDAESGTDKT